MKTVKIRNLVNRAHELLNCYYRYTTTPNVIWDEAVTNLSEALNELTEQKPEAINSVIQDCIDEIEAHGNYYDRGEDYPTLIISKEKAIEILKKHMK